MSPKQQAEPERWSITFKKELARRVDDVPLGQGALDIAVAQLVVAGKLGKDGHRELKCHQARWRKEVVTAYSAAVQARSRELWKVERQSAKWSSAQLKRQEKLEAAIASFLSKSLPSPVRLHEATEYLSSLSELLNAAVVASEKLSRSLKRAVDREPETRGRRNSLTYEFCIRLAGRWHKFTGDFASVTRDTTSASRSGPFVKLIEAACQTLQIDLDGNVGVTAERAAAWFKREFKRFE